MRSEFKISPVAETKLPADMLQQFAPLFVRLTALIYLLPVCFSAYRNFVVEPSPAGWIIVGMYLAFVLFAWKGSNSSPLLQFWSVTFLLTVAATLITIRNGSFVPATTTVLFASMALILVVGLRKALISSLVFIMALFALDFRRTHPDLPLALIHLSLSLAVQTAVLLAVNMMWNLFTHNKTRLEQALQLMETASTLSRIGFFRHDQQTDRWLVNDIYRQMYGINHNEQIHGGEHVIAATHPDDREEVIASIRHGVKLGNTLSVKHRLIGDLGPRWVRVTVKMTEENGLPISYGSIVDIHDEALRQNELEKLRVKANLANAAFKLGIIDGPLSTRMLSLDATARQIFGIQSFSEERSYHAEELIAGITSTERERAFELLKSLEHTAEPVEFRFQLHTDADQPERWIRGVLTKYLDVEQQDTLLAVIEDISDSVAAQKRLEAADMEKRDLLDQLNLATDEADIRIIEENLNRSTARFITRGKSPRPSAPSYADRLELVPDEYLPKLQQAYEEPGSVSEYPIIGKHYMTGVEWLRQLYVRKYERDGEEYALFMVTSVTQQKKSQLQLERSFKQVEQSLERLDEIAKAGQIGMFDWSRDSDILRPNAIFREQTELSEDRYPIISTRSFFRLFEEADGLTCFNQLREAEPDSGAMEFQLRMQTESGKVRWVRLIASVHQPKGEGAKVSGSLIDLTEHLELEQQLRDANAALQRQSRTDPLTQIANRRALDEYLESQISLRQRDPNSHFSLLMLDIDYFKPFNDIYGHPEGDVALKCVAQVLEEATQRPGDMAARFGGEEFVIVLPDTDLQGAMQISSKIQQQLKQEAIVHEGSPTHALTASIGITTLSPMQVRGPTELIELADAALYAAKENGRNRVEIKQIGGPEA